MPSRSSGEAVEKVSAEVVQAEEATATRSMDMETAAGGATSSEPLARQIVPRGKDPLVAPSTGGPVFASPRDLGSGAA